MNTVILIGRLTKDPDIKKTQTDISVLSFTIAVNRSYKNQDGDYEADFINCVAWKKTAELIAEYFKKGDRIGIQGELQTRTYQDRDDKTVFVTEINVRQIDFLQEKTQQESREQKVEPKADKTPEEFEIDDEEMPF